MSRMLLAIALATFAQAEPHWVEEEVAYIITERERELFLSLTTAEERQHFITAFWAKRDPNPTTPENEFRDEHYRRLDYANRFLGRESFLPGWQTDRGRYYVILGEPRTVQRFYGRSDLKEAELWFFQGRQDRGVPAFFYLLFFKPDDVGDYRLYHPLMDGPQSLLRGTETNAVEKLEAIDTELAHASLSLDAGEPPDLLAGRAAIGVDALLARIEDSPKRAVNTDYIDAFLTYGERAVSADYSFNWVPNRNLFSVMLSEDSTPIVHYSIELDPTSFGLETDEEQTKFYTTLDVSVEVKTPDKTLVHATSRSTYIELSPQQVKEVETAPIAYEDDFPLVPGRYVISVYLQNRALKNYTVAEADISILEPVPATITDVILCRDAKSTRDTIAANEVRTFQLGTTRLEPAVGNVFALGDTVTVFAQAHAPPEGAVMWFEMLDGDDVHDRAAGQLTRELSTIGLSAGSYEVRVRLVDAHDTVISEKRAELTLSPRNRIPRPAFVYRRGFNTRVPGLLALVRGDQYWRLSRFDAALDAYQSAVAAGNPELPQARWKLATAYLRTGDAERALPLLAPLEKTHPEQFDVVAGLGLSFYLNKEYRATIDYLERAMALRPPDTSILNALGDAHQRLGNVEDAKRYFERSLALDPDQDAVQKRLER